MVGQYLLPGTIGLTAAIFNVEFLPRLVGFVDALKVKRAKKSGGDLLEDRELINGNSSVH